MAACTADLFSHAGHTYLVFADRYSDYPFVSSWRFTPTSDMVCTALACIFRDVGIPKEITSDGGTQFTAATFKRFATAWGFHHRLSSPHHSRGNGHAESAVKKIKYLLEKLNLSDIKHPLFCMGLLELRNTPAEDGLSPAQKFFGRSLRTRLPKANLSITDVISKAKARRRRRLAAKKQHHDRSSKTLPPIEQGTFIWVQDPDTKRWDQDGQVLDVLDYRNYLVLLESTGRTVRRNRIFIRPKITSSSPAKGGGGEQLAAQDGTKTAPRAHPRGNKKRKSVQTPRRSGRNRRAPSRYEA